MIHGETLHSPLPWDLPLWMPDHVIFFGVLYSTLGIISLAVGYAVVKAYMETLACPCEKTDSNEESH